MTRLFAIVALTGLFFTAAKAQTESTLYFMTSVPQSFDANPSFIPNYKVVVGLPVLSSVAGIYSNNGFSFNDIVTRNNGTTQISLSQLTGSLAEKNYFHVAANTDIFRVGVYLNPKLYMMVSATARAYNQAMIEKGLVSLLVDGTTPIVNSYSNTAPEEDGNSFLETNFGLAWKKSDKLTLGGRLKYLNGFINVATESSSLVIQVDNNYMITATGSAVIHSSGLADLGRTNHQFDMGSYFKNSGWGLDLGASYQIDEKLRLSASLTDLGFINWRNNTVNYTLDPAKAKYTFGGIDVSQLLDGTSASFKAQLDSIEQKFKMSETSTGSYTTWLPTKFYLSGNYEVIKDLYVGALFFGQTYKGRTAAGMTAAVSKNLGKWLNASLSYTVSSRSYNNLGAGLSFNFAPVQFYIVGDNLLAAPASLVTDQNLNNYFNNSQLLTLRTGLNIIIKPGQGGVAKERVNEDNHNPKKSSNKKVKSTYGRSPQKKK